jgi:hypothetical protein
MNYPKKKKKEIKKTILFIEASKEKTLGINVSKEVNGLFAESYKTLMKEVEEDTNRKIYHVHG